MKINKVAVIGSGVMGSAIAAQFINADIPTILLDTIPTSITEEEKALHMTLKDKQVRNRYVNQAVEKLKNTKPSPITSLRKLALLEVGNVEDDFSMIGECDWIIESITENLQAKKALLKKIDQKRKKGSIISSNTSGIPINEMKDGLSEDLQSHFLGTHFFNPPRYIKLLEIIPTEETNPEIVKNLKLFIEETLGKVVVEAKDTPNFIANRIGAFAFLVTWREMNAAGLSILEVDEITGPLIGRSKSATFQTLDMVGIDTFYHVIQNIANRSTTKEERDMYTIPPLLEEMMHKNILGRKTTKGFYEKTQEGLMVLDYQSLNYVKAAPKKNKLKKKLVDIIFEETNIGNFLWRSMTPFFTYSARLLGEVADSIYSIDQAVKAGFNWEKGPFETWDQIGLTASINRMKQDQVSIPEWIIEMLENGNTSFYKELDHKLHYYHHGSYLPVPNNDLLTESKKNASILSSNQAASIIDMGDGVLLLDLHSKNNLIGMDILDKLSEAIDRIEENPSYKGLVIGSKEKIFSAGANVLMMLLVAQNEDEIELEAVVHHFQQTLYKLKYCKKPIVTAAYQNTMGGGAEICLASSQVQASIETYIGLVETFVGLIPGGGGTKELYLNSLKQNNHLSEKELLTITSQVFETILTGKVSTSAEHGKELGYLEKNDRITNNEKNLVKDAKQTVIQLFNEDYLPPVKRKIPVTGNMGFQMIMKEVNKRVQKGELSNYGAIIAEKLAYVLTGGKVEFGTEVEEDYLLKLEKEAFIYLLQQQETQNRMLHLIQTGKPYKQL